MTSRAATAKGGASRRKLKFPGKLTSFAEAGGGRIIGMSRLDGWPDNNYIVS